jgi:hypothetical protein
LHDEVARYDEVQARLDELTGALESQRREIERLRARLRRRATSAPADGTRSSRRTLLKTAGMAAMGVAGTGALLDATASPAAAADSTIDGKLVVRGSSSDATASEIGDGTNALTIRGGGDGVKLASKANNRVLVDAQLARHSDDDHRRGSNLDINKPAAVFRQTGENHKGAMIEFQQYLASGRHSCGVATNTPGATFDVPTTGHKRVAWILAHYDSPNPADAVHQHLNFETCKADLQTIVTRFQISWGEDIALVSFPNSNVRVIQSDRLLSFGGANQVRAAYSSGRRKLGFAGDPVDFAMGQLQVADTWVSPTYFARKPSNESLSNSSTLRDDAHLRVPVAADAVYTFDAFVVYRAHAAADLRVQWSVPSGATLRWTPGGAGIVTEGIVGPMKSSANGTEPVNVGGAGTANAMAFVATGIVRTTASGWLQLRWAQDRAHASTLTIERDSYLQLTRVV